MFVLARQKPSLLGFALAYHYICIQYIVLAIMKVLIINTAERKGGAAIAANRLMKALSRNGVEAKMLVRDRATHDVRVVSLPADMKRRWHFLEERMRIWIANGFSKANLFGVDIASSGSDITSLQAFKEADVIHLHWVNQGMLSLDGLRAILGSGKPVVWTMHDMWPFTGICHYSDGCDRYTADCGDCHLLRYPGERDLSRRVFDRKKAIYGGGDIAFVACSRWLASLAERAALTKGHYVTDIPNAIDTEVFCPGDKEEARLRLKLPADRHMLLFGSMKTTDKRKGIDYLIEASRLLAEKYPELADTLGVMVLGAASAEYAESFPFPIYCLGYVNDERELVDIYNAADLYVTPSLQDNLPNTIVEAMSCGTPCVGFDTGGIPQMIAHRVNGYVARYKSAEDLAEGIYTTLYCGEYDRMCRNARAEAVAQYSEPVAAARYVQVYEGLISQVR